MSTKDEVLRKAKEQQNQNQPQRGNQAKPMPQQPVETSGEHGIKKDGDLDERTVSPFERGQDGQGHGTKKDGDIDERTVSPYERASQAGQQRQNR